MSYWIKFRIESGCRLLSSLRAARKEYRGQVYEVEVEEERYVFVFVCVCGGGQESQIVEVFAEAQ